jgi:hypothetical protein
MQVSEDEIKKLTPEMIKNLANFLRIIMGKEPLKESNPNEVRIVVTENLGLGEKLGG